MTTAPKACERCGCQNLMESPTGDFKNETLIRCMDCTWAIYWSRPECTPPSHAPIEGPTT